MRLDILKIMRRDSFGVLELCQIFDVQQPSMSHHLKVMVKAGLLGSRREGNSIFYRRVQNASENEQRLLNQIYAIADIGQADQRVLGRVDQIQAARKQKSQQFFQENVESFHEQQDLIASHGDYGDAVQDLMRFGKELIWLEVGLKRIRSLSRLSLWTSLRNCCSKLKSECHLIRYRLFLAILPML